MSRLNNPLTKTSLDRTSMYGARATGEFKSQSAAANVVLVEVLTDPSGDVEFELPVGTRGVIPVDTALYGPPSTGSTGPSYTFSAENVIPVISMTAQLADTTYLFLAVS